MQTPSPSSSIRHSCNRNGSRSPVNSSHGSSSSLPPGPSSPGLTRMGSIDLPARVTRFSSHRRVSDISLDLTQSSVMSAVSTNSSDGFLNSPSWTYHDSTSSNTVGTVGSKWENCSVKFRAKNFVGQRQAPFEGVYRLGELLGQGGYGEVYRCWHLETGQERAVKVVPKDPACPESSMEVMKEFHILKECDHPNLLKVYEMFEGEINYYIVTDILKGGELYDEVLRCGNFTEEDTQVLMTVLLSCLNYCHPRGLVHRDLKPENILLEADRDFHSLKIIDFGLAQQTITTASTTSTAIPAPLQAPLVEPSYFEGSKYYLAPETIKRQSRPSSKCDIWACGVIAFVMLGGYAPFDGDTDEQIHSAILDGHLRFRDQFWGDVSDEAKEFIRLLLTHDEDARPSAETMLQHPWLSSARARYDDDDDSDVQKRRRTCTQESLTDLQRFHSAHSKLKQATCAIIASQFLSNQEREDIDEIFRSLDTAGKGSLAPEDLRRAYGDFFPVDDSDAGGVVSDEQIQELLKQVNFSGSGAIEYSEFVIATMMEKNMIDDHKIRAAFAYFDKDGTGFIGPNNLKEVLHIDDSLGRAADAYVTKKIIAQVDANGDGMIDFQEFKNMLMSRTVRRMAVKRSSSRLLSKSSLQELLEGMEDSETSYSFRKNDNPNLDDFDYYEEDQFQVSLLDDGSLQSHASSMSSQRRTQRTSVSSSHRQSITILEEPEEFDSSQRRIQRTSTNSLHRQSVTILEEPEESDDSDESQKDDEEEENKDEDGADNHWEKEKLLHEEEEGLLPLAGRRRSPAIKSM